MWQAPGVRHEMPEHAEHLWLYFYRCSVTPKLVCVAVELEIFESVDHQPFLAGEGYRGTRTIQAPTGASLIFRKAPRHLQAGVKLRPTRLS